MSRRLESSSPDVDALFSRAREGDQDAWTDLFQACYPKIIRVIRRRLDSPQIRSIYDSTDFASDVMKSFAANAQQLDFRDMSSLMGFLTKVAESKLADEYRRQSALKRDRGREEPGAEDYASSDPTPSAIAVGHESLNRFLNHPDPAVREIVQLRHDGYGNDEIAKQLRLNVRNVQRKLKHLEDTSQKPGA